MLSVRQLTQTPFKPNMITDKCLPSGAVGIQVGDERRVPVADGFVESGSWRKQRKCSSPNVVHMYLVPPSWESSLGPSFVNAFVSDG